MKFRQITNVSENLFSFSPTPRDENNFPNDVSTRAPRTSPELFTWRGKVFSAFMFTLFCCCLAQQAFAQSITPCSTAVKIGNFGVDGDFYANTPASIGSNDDDWFNSTLYPGPGFGVIGVTAATANPPISAAAFRSIIQSGSGPVGRNYTYVQRMSVPFGTVV